MNSDVAEAILALAEEMQAGARLSSDEGAFRADWRVRYAAERVIERVFQAARDLPTERLEQYFGGDGFRTLRGMRNRLAHNYLDIDDDILWESVSVDLPAALDRIAVDVPEATALISQTFGARLSDMEDWDRDHLGQIGPDAE